MGCTMSKSVEPEALVAQTLKKGAEGADTDAAEPVAAAPDAAEKTAIAAKRGRGRRVSVSAEVDAPSAGGETEFKPRVIEKTPEQLKRIQNSVKENFLFSGLDPAQRKIVLDAMEEKKVTAGQVIITQGETGDYFYVVDTGKFSVTLKNVNNGNPVLNYAPGQSFGELALMYNCPRAASVTCDSDGVLWVLDRLTFRKVVIESMSQKKKKYEHFLENVPLLEKLTSEEKSKLADVLESAVYPPGDVIIREADEDYDKMKLFFIEKGVALATTTDEKGTRVVVGRMGEKEYFGEKALIERKPRAATVSAEEETTCAYLDIAAFERIMGPCRDVMERRINEYARAESGHRYEGPHAIV